MPNPSEGRNQSRSCPRPVRPPRAAAEFGGGRERPRSPQSPQPTAKSSPGLRPGPSLQRCPSSGLPAAGWVSSGCPASATTPEQQRCPGHRLPRGSCSQSRGPPPHLPGGTVQGGEQKQASAGTWRKGGLPHSHPSTGWGAFWARSEAATLTQPSCSQRALSPLSGLVLLPEVLKHLLCALRQGWQREGGLQLWGWKVSPDTEVPRAPTLQPALGWPLGPPDPGLPG